MILNVYCYYNKLLQAYGNFQLDDHEPEKVVMHLERDLRASYLKGQAENLRYIDLYKLGTFDDEKGVFENAKELLLDLGNVLASYDAQKAAEKENKEVNA